MPIPSHTPKPNVVSATPSILSPLLSPDIRESFASIEENLVPICLLSSEGDFTVEGDEGNEGDINLLSTENIAPPVPSVWTVDSPRPVVAATVTATDLRVHEEYIEEMSSSYTAKLDAACQKKEFSPVSTSMVSPFNTPPCSPFARILKESDAPTVLMVQPELTPIVKDLSWMPSQTVDTSSEPVEVTTF